MEYASEQQIDRLPAFDLVFNAIGDQDVSARSADVVRLFLQRCDKPLLNRPESIARTAREQIPTLLADIDHLVVPQAMRLSGVANRLPADRLRDGGLHPPLLLRPVGSHGGVGLQLIESAAALAALNLAPHDHYACDYRNYCSADGYFRKYRVIFIDGEPYPYHLAISRHWLVHYVSAEMLPHAWKRAEEQRFLDDPAAVLGPLAMQALRAIGQRMNLDFCGIDFSLLEDGRILLFEANATMLVHLEQFHAALRFKNPYVQRILDAFDRMLNRRVEVFR
jgi:glutathione synthase/RimK-type ligase-like ATP-grasp enzyme